MQRREKPRTGSDLRALSFRLFRKVRTDPGSDLTESTEKTQKHTEKKEKKGSERALTRISRKTRKDANEFLKIKKCSRAPCFFVLFVFLFLCFSVRFQWIQW